MSEFRKSFSTEKYVVTYPAALRLAYSKNEMTHFIAGLPKDLATWPESKLLLSKQAVDTLIAEKLKTF